MYVDVRRTYQVSIQKNQISKCNRSAGNDSGHILPFI